MVRVAVGQPLMMLDFRPAREDHQLLMCVDGIKSRERSRRRFGCCQPGGAGSRALTNLRPLMPSMDIKRCAAFGEAEIKHQGPRQTQRSRIALVLEGVITSTRLDHLAYRRRPRAGIMPR